jgi:hypothetical protein
MSLGADDREAAEMARAIAWNEDTPASQIADFLPRKSYERWLDLGFGLLVAALLGGWLLLPPPPGQSPAASPSPTSPAPASQARG